MDETKECEHEWKWIKDWYGDKDVPYGTQDCSRWECKLCGAENHDMDAPSKYD